jgi:HAD superfamily hydrolase (TIGR01509 family)
MIHALIFDFDGLILDTESAVYQSWHELYQANGCDLSFSDWAKIIGTNDLIFNPLDELEKQMGKPLDRESALHRIRQRVTELVARQPVMPGIQDYLASARRMKLKLGIATCSPYSRIIRYLDALGLTGSFDAITTIDDVSRSKPDPEIYYRALEKLGVESGQAVVFEDSPNGVLAAKNAGITCVAVPNALTRMLAFDHADFRVNSLADLPLEALLQRINGRSGSAPGARASV